jgi:hypothetical protein
VILIRLPQCSERRQLRFSSPGSAARFGPTSWTRGSSRESTITSPARGDTPAGNAPASSASAGDGPPSLASTCWRRVNRSAVSALCSSWITIAWLASLVWMMWRGALPFKLMASILVAAACLLAVPSDWQHNPYTDFGYQPNVDKFNQMPAGASHDFPLNPAGWWQMTLIKH